MKFFLLILFLLSSCSNLPQDYFKTRSISGDSKQIDYALAVDRFHYYLTEFTQFQSGKINDEIIGALEAITPQMIFDLNFSLESLSDPNQLDGLIHKSLAAYFSDLQFSESELVWNHNFFKKKLVEAFALKPVNFKPIYTYLSHEDLVSQVLSERSVIEIDPASLTLNSGHYISNRMTRGVFWNAIELNQPIEFHVGDNRQFLKYVEANGGRVLYEVTSLARNYNKIFIVNYPGSDLPHVAITNIGGHDRLEHLVHQISLSNIGNSTINNKILVVGDIGEYHQLQTRILKIRLGLLPSADRVIIGQKGAIDVIFGLLWKIKALKNIYEHNKSFATSLFKNQKDLDQILLAPLNLSKIKELKSTIEDIFKTADQYLTNNAHLVPEQFKQFTWDLNAAELSDYVFLDENGKQIRWRVVSNVWGDEIVPIANALKETGHQHVTYIGTAGAFPESGFKVGDIVIPDTFYDEHGKARARGESLVIDGAKIGGSVEHVASPFEETHQWLENSKQRSNLVEIETNYLARIFNGNNNHFRAYLLVSDVLSSESETLANASHSRRKNSLNKLIVSLFNRDCADPAPVRKFQNPEFKFRDFLNKYFTKLSESFKYYLFSIYNGELDVGNIEDFIKQTTSFTDEFHLKKLAEASEVISYLVGKINEVSLHPDLGIEKSFLEGKWNPKLDSLNISLLAVNAQVAAEYRQVLASSKDILDKIDWLKIEVIRGPPPPEMVRTKISPFADADMLVRAYAEGGVHRFGLDVQTVFTGNTKYIALPTLKSEYVCKKKGNLCSLSYFPPDEVTRDLLNKLKVNNQQSLERQLNEYIENLNQKLESDRVNRNGFKGLVQIKIVDQIANGKLAEIKPSASKSDGLIIELIITKSGLENPAVVFEEMAHLNQIIWGYFSHPGIWAELTLNAEFGSKRSQLILAQAEVDVIDIMANQFSDQITGDDFTNYLNARRSHAESILVEAKRESKLEETQRHKIGEKWKKFQDDLDKEKEKLNDYIAKNDRKNVKKIIESYMPWNDMEPVEIAMWKKWLDAIEKPLDKSKAILTFRGIGGDTIGKSENGDYLMAKLLTKNQGNYNRRLRSLKTYRSKMASRAERDYRKFDNTIFLTLNAHSKDPFGSPYMSFAHFNKAYHFSFGEGASGVAAVLVNPDRVIQNLFSTYITEKELLIPLLVFPEEVVLIETSSSIKVVGFDGFKQNIERKIGRKLKQVEVSYILNENNGEITKKWWDLINPSKLNPSSVPSTCEDIMKLFMH